MRERDADLRALFAVHTDTAVRGQLCRTLGAQALAEVPAEDRMDVLTDVLSRVLPDLRTGVGMYGTNASWRRFLETIEEPTLLALPWPQVRSLACEVSQVAGWLTGRLSESLTEPGTVRIFSSVDTTFTGPTGTLFEALCGATAVAC